MKDFSVIILSAGNSQRMGKSKAMLSFNRKLNFLEQLVLQYAKAGLKKIHIVSQEERMLFDHIDNSRIHWIQNKDAEKGRAWSIYLSLSEVDPLMPVFIQNIDNPFTDEKLILRMCNEFYGGKVLVPVFQNKKAHPILLPPQIIGQILKLDFESFDFKQIIQQYPSKLMQFSDERIQANINTHEDYQIWFGKA